jgi:hypothetical protein
MLVKEDTKCPGGFRISGDVRIELIINGSVAVIKKFELTSSQVLWLNQFGGWMLN